jgi:hypothetical protein
VRLVSFVFWEDCRNQLIQRRAWGCHSG